jgi:F-type H+-transporting ATPase subunit alpha
MAGIAIIHGLPNVQSEELLRFEGGGYGMALDLQPNQVGVILFDKDDHLEAGSKVQRTNRVLDVPVGTALLGRVVDALGRPLDNQGAIHSAVRMPVERQAPAIMDRAPVTEPLLTGIKVIDALIPIGKGQRELILGDRQTGKTSIGVDSIINQKGKNVVCIYCAIGKRAGAAAQVIEELRRHRALEYSIVVVSTAENTPGLQFVAPYAATTMGEYFLHQGKDVLLVYDDLTLHARAYRELSLLLRRPPGREAFPGDIFYIHSRLLERATHLRPELGGGSLTALPIVETEAQNISGYIPTNIISITDGQIYLSPNLFQKGIFPAIDVGASVSRVGGKAQLKAYRTVTGSLRLSYSQFEELEAFARFGTRLDPETRNMLTRGYRVRAALKQQRSAPLTPGEQIALFLVINEGLLDDIPTDEVQAAERELLKVFKKHCGAILIAIESNDLLPEEAKQAVLETARNALNMFKARGEDSGNS